jgi:hypothetical protein
MKNEHAACQANDIKQKRLLGGNPAQKKNQICFLFSLIFYFSHFTLFLSFSYIPFLLFQHRGQCCVLSVGVLGEFLFSLLSLKRKRKSKFDL